MNSLLPQHRKVVDIEYMPTEHQGQITDNKEYHYDFMCRDEDGAVFIVEMQNFGELARFKKRCEACEIARFDESKRIKYEQDMYDQRRLNGELAFARRKGIEEGLEKGLAEGKAEGKAEGIRETALKMLELSMSIDVISSVTGLTEEQINELRNE